MTSLELIDSMNAHAPQALQVLGGKIVSFDEESGVIEMHYEVDESLCHSGNIVQGGFLAGMLDAAMAHAVFGVLKAFVIVATLEMKVSYLEIARPGTIIGRGWITRMGKTVSFLEGELKNSDGLVLARSSSTARIIHKISNHASDSR